MPDSTPVLTAQTSIRVRYADTDQMHFVYNGKYLEYFEVGRTEMLRALGLPYAELERNGIMLPLVDSYCRYHGPARYDDMLVIESRMQEMPRATMRIDYRIFREGEDLILTSGYTTHAFVDIESGKPTRPAKLFLDAVRSPLPSSQP